MKKFNIFLTVFCLQILCGGLIFSTPGFGQVWYVDSAAPLGGDGKSWSSAFRDIQSAIDAASSHWIKCFGPPDQVKVRAGTYYVTSQIEVNKYVSIIGGYDGEGHWDWKNNPTIIDGQHITRCLHITSPCIISGFIIKNGQHDHYGGAVMIESTPSYCATLNYYHVPIIRNCKFTENTAPSGGAIFDLGSDARIRDSLFENNSAAGSGGALFHSASGPNIERCIFSNNRVDSDLAYGGAVYGTGHNLNTDQYARITNCLFVDNESTTWGGAIAYHQVYPKIVNCTFTGNIAGSGGGAFYGFIHSEAPKLWNSIFWGDEPDELHIVTADPYFDVRYCDIEGGWTGPGYNNIAVDPEFAGGSDYRLNLNSPCIDAGANYLGPTDDLNGAPRPIDGNGDGEAIIDIGAYEHPMPGDLDGNNLIDGMDIYRYAIIFINDYYNPEGDLNGDLKVDEEDLRIFASFFGTIVYQ